MIIIFVFEICSMDILDSSLTHLVKNLTSISFLTEINANSLTRYLIIPRTMESEKGQIESLFDDTSIGPLLTRIQK